MLLWRRIKGNESENDFALLANDILLYNGMGCRNVSNVLVPQGYDLSGLIQALNSWDKSRMTESFRKTFLWEKAIAEMKGKIEFACEAVVCLHKEILSPARIACLHVVSYRDEIHLAELIAKAKPHIQCIAGIDTRFGETQSPHFHDFADGVDTMKLLSGI